MDEEEAESEAKVQNSKELRRRATRRGVTTRVRIRVVILKTKKDGALWVVLKTSKIK